jgi:hypothetical protein
MIDTSVRFTGSNFSGNRERSAVNAGMSSELHCSRDSVSTLWLHRQALAGTTESPESEQL